MKTLAILQNADFEGPGRLPGWAAELNFEVTIYRAYLGELPAPGGFSHLVVLGTPHSVHEIPSVPWLSAVSALAEGAIRGGQAVLGICFGAQLMASVLGAKVEVGEQAEIGWHQFPAEPWPRAWAKVETAALFQWHREFFTVPSGAEAFGISAAGYLGGFCVGKKLLAVSGHLEITPALVADYIARCWDKGAGITGAYHQSIEAMIKREPIARARDEAFARAIFFSWLTGI